MKRHNFNINLIYFLVAVFVLSSLIYNTNKISAEDCNSTCSVYTDETEKKDCEDKCQDLEKKAKMYEDIIKLKDKQQKTLNAQIEALNQEQQTSQTELRSARMEWEEINQRISALEESISEKETLIKTQKSILMGLMQSYYEYDQQGLLSLAILDQDWSEIVNQSDYIEQSGTRASEVLEEIQDTKNQLMSDKQELEKKKQESEQVKEKLEEKNLNLQYSENQKIKLLGQTQAEKQKYEELLKNIENEINDLEVVKESSVDYSKLPPAKGDYFDYPVSSVRITQGYGKTSFSNHYVSGRHNGVDFGVSYKPVYAVRDGKVIGSGDNGRYAYGKWIAIDHGDGLVTLYGHFSSKSVSKGDKVDKGDKIGISGNTGFSTGPHLHFSVFAKSSYEVVESKYVKGLMIPTGASVNPMKYF